MNRRSFLRRSAAAVTAALASPGLSHAALQTLSEVPGDIRAVTGDRRDIVLEKAAVAELADALRGHLLLPGSADYETARHVRNASIDKYPALIVQPSGVADIQHAVTFARERELLLAVKCGGHSWSGKSSCNGGLQIDLSTMRHVRVDPQRRMAFAAGGSLLGELDHEAMAHGLVTTAGTVSHTGIGGLTLGGGFGRLARRFGLALDNVRGAQVVTADGQLRYAGPDDNPDLYWGLRGGGGNFGVVTGFEFGLHPMQRTVIGGDLVFPVERTRDVLAFYADLHDRVSDNLYCDFILVRPPAASEQPGMAILNVCHSGTAAEAERELAQFDKLGTPVANTLRPVDYVELQRSYDEADPRAAGSYLKSGFVANVSDALVDRIGEVMVDDYAAHPEASGIFFFQVAGGAIARVPADATAFPHRWASHSYFTVTSWPPGSANARAHMDATRARWRRLEEFSGGYYTNETADEGQQVINQNYQGNFARLVKVKNQYDPTNLFRLNANVEPTVSA